MLIRNGKFPLCAWLRPHYLAPAHSHCFSYVKAANISAPETPRQIQRRKDGGSRGKVSLERECRLTLTLGLHFSKRVCVRNYSCPARHFTECLHFWRGLYLPRAWGPTGWVYTTSEHSRTSARTHTNTAGFGVLVSDRLSKRRVLSYTHPSWLHSALSGAAFFLRWEPKHSRSRLPSVWILDGDKKKIV